MKNTITLVASLCAAIFIQAQDVDTATRYGADVVIDSAPRTNSASWVKFTTFSNTTFTAFGCSTNWFSAPLTNITFPANTTVIGGFTNVTIAAGGAVILYKAKP